MRISLLLVCLWLLLPLELSLAGERLFVSSCYDNVVNVFHADSLTPAGSPVAVGVFPNQVVPSPAGDALYVANYTTADISVIDPMSLAVTKTIELSCSPFSLDIAPDGDSAHAVCRNTGRIVHVDLATGVETGQTAVTFPYDLALGSQGRFAYVTRLFFSRYLYVVDLESQSVVATVRVGRSPKGVVADPNGQFVYVANSGSGTVSVVATATNKVVRNIPIGADPNALTIDRDGSFLYVSHKRGGTVSVVDLAAQSMVASIEVGVAPERLTLSGDGSRLYVANFDSNTVSVIDNSQRSVVGTIPTANGPFDVALLEQRDVTPPELTLAPDQAMLWPPNHKLRDINMRVVATDNQDPNPQWKLVSIVSSEPCAGLDSASPKAERLRGASPQNCSDIVGAEYGSHDVDFRLRAERFAYNGDDRVYTVTYEATDSAGNTATASVDIRVPLHHAPN